MAENEYDGVDIPEDLLEGIAGGEMTDLVRFNIECFVRSWKASGMTLEQVLNKFSFVIGTEDEVEILDYVTQCYNSF